MLKKLMVSMLSVCMVLSAMSFAVMAEVKTKEAKSSRVYKYMTDTANVTDESATQTLQNNASGNKARFFFVFNDIEEAEHISDTLNFNIGGNKNGASLSGSPTVFWAVVNHDIDSVDKMKNIIKFDGTNITFQNVYKTNETKIGPGLVPDPKHDTRKMYNIALDKETLAMTPGQSLVVYMYLDGSSAWSNLGSNTATGATLNYSYDESAFKSEILNDLKSANTATIEDVLKMYNNTLNINVSSITEENVADIAGYIAGLRFADILDVKKAYEKALAPKPLQIKSIKLIDLEVGENAVIADVSEATGNTVKVICSLANADEQEKPCAVVVGMYASDMLIDAGAEAKTALKKADGDTTVEFELEISRAAGAEIKIFLWDNFSFAAESLDVEIR